jgi:hypothetical protein
LGFLLAPAAGLVTAWLIFEATHLMHRGFAEYGHRTPLGVDDLAPAYAFALLVGVPLYALFNTFRLFRFWHSLATGIVMGLLLYVVLMLVTPAKLSAVDIQGSLACAFLGGVTTSTFWLLAIRPGKAKT